MGMLSLPTMKVFTSVSPGRVPAVAEKAEEKAPNQIHTTLEVNLMLAFLFTAGLLCKVPLLEKDVLVGAQRN